MEIKSFLAALLVSVKGWSNKQAADFVDDDANITPEKVLELQNEYTEFIDKIKLENSTEGYKKANREVLGLFEKAVKSKFGVTTNKTGVDLVEEIVQAKAAAPGEVSEDAVKKHPTYIKLEQEFEQEKTGVEGKINTLKGEFEYKETLKEVAQNALGYFKSKNPNLASDAIKAQRQEQLLVRELENSGYKFKKLQDGTFAVENADGTRAERKGGHSKSFHDLVDETAENLGFEFKLATARTGPESTSGTPPPPSEKTYKGEAPKDSNSYVALISDTKLSNAEKSEIIETYGKEFST